MPNLTVDQLIENAEKGIRENKPNFVHQSTKVLKGMDKADLAEKILKQARELYPNQVSYFRELSSLIIDRNPNEGLNFAIENESLFGVHALFQKAVALNKLDRNIEAIRIIEGIIEKDKSAKEDRWIVSKLAGLYIQEGLLEQARQLMEPLIDSGVFTDVRMKQILVTILLKLRKSLPKAQELLKDAVDPHSSKLKKKAQEIETIENLSESQNNQFTVERKGILFEDKVFLVHGHDNEAKEKVARFLEKLNLNITILHEQPNLGRTIIEKFEDHSGVGYAVVLLTGDDVGNSKEQKDNLKPRARQNVIYELGFFMGKLGRTHVCALKTDGVEEPSDLSGVLYIPLDSGGAWKLRLAGEIKAAGIGIDLNLAM